MKRIFLFALAISAFVGCSDDSSDETQLSGALRTVTLDLSCCNRLFAENGSQPVLLPDEGTAMRFTVEAVPSAGYGTAARTSLTVSADQATAAMELPVEACTLLVWAEYLPEERPTGYYDVSSLSSLFYDAPYEVNTPFRDAFRAAVELPAGTLSAAIGAERPSARCEVIATDLEEFLRKNPGLECEDLTVRVSYRGFLPYGYNVRTEKPNLVREGVGATARPLVLSEGEMLLLSDDILANDPGSFVEADLQVCDASGRVVAGVAGIRIDYERDRITTVRGRFLTASSGSSAEIDPDYRGDYDYDFD